MCWISTHFATPPSQVIARRSFERVLLHASQGFGHPLFRHVRRGSLLYVSRCQSPGRYPFRNLYMWRFSHHVARAKHLALGTRGDAPACPVRMTIGHRSSAGREHLGHQSSCWIDVFVAALLSTLQATREEMLASRLARPSVTYTDSTDLGLYVLYIRLVQILVTRSRQEYSSV